LVIKQRYDREIESAKLYIKEINQEILNLRDRVDNSQELREKIAEVSKSLEDWEYYTQMKDKESEEIQRLEKLVSKNKAKYEMMKEQKDALQSVLGLKGSECPTCHTLITEKNIQHIQSLASQINKDVMECVQSIKKLKSDIEIHTNSRNRAADNLARLNKLKTEEIKLKEKLKEVLERGTRIEQLKQKIANHKAASAQIIDKIKADYNNKKGDLGFYKKYDAEKLDEYQQMYEQLESKRQITENKEKEIDFQIKSYYNNNSKIKDIKQLIEKDSERFEIMTFWTKSLPKIKVEMIGEVIPFIESEANKYLSQILSGKMIKFTVDPNKNSNKLDITIHDYENGVDRIFEGWCGGEKDSMCMCTFMALNKLASVRNKKQIPFIILDEKFASVESEKRTKWLDMLRREYKGRKIWAISHAHGIETEFDQIVKMTKQNHVSSFEIVNNFHQ
jgi:DNA repair exonuclease SbcCD ATPase subunit